MADMRRHWLFRAISALVVMVMVSMTGMPLVHAAELRKANLNRMGGIPDFGDSRYGMDPSANRSPGRAPSATVEVAQPVLPASLERLSADDPRFDPGLLFDGSDAVQAHGAFRMRVRFSSPQRLGDVALFGAASSMSSAEGVLKVWRDRGAQS